MSTPRLDHIQTWVFDLDNTLYDPRTRLFDQIEPKMVEWVMKTAGVDKARADEMRLDYWKRYGVTWAGLNAEYDFDVEAFLHDVHQIDFSVLAPRPDLAKAIAALPGRAIVYTNGTKDYALNVLYALEITDKFDAIYGVQEADLSPKPNRDAFERVFAKDGLTPTRAAMFEDEPRNLKVPFEMGLSTIYVAPEPIEADHIHHHTNDLAEFLSTATTIKS